MHTYTQYASNMYKKCIDCNFSVFDSVNPLGKIEIYFTKDCLKDLQLPQLDALSQWREIFYFCIPRTNFFRIWIYESLKFPKYFWVVLFLKKGS